MLSFFSDRSMIDRINAFDQSGWPFGLEKCLAGQIDMTLPISSPQILNWPKGPLSYHLDQSAAFGFDRVDSELISLSVWSKVKSGNLSAFDLQNACRIARGNPRMRTSDIFTKRFDSGERVRFTRPETVAKRLSQLIMDINQVEPGSGNFRFCVYAMVEFLAIHPFYDGNGRVGRALFQSLLGKVFGLKKSLVPVGAVQFFNRKVYLWCLLKLYLDKSAEDIISFERITVYSTVNFLREFFQPRIV